MSIVGFDFFGLNNTLPFNTETNIFNAPVSPMWPSGSTNVSHSFQSLLPPVGVVCGCPPTGKPNIFQAATPTKPPVTANVIWVTPNKLKLLSTTSPGSGLSILIQPSYRAEFKIKNYVVGTNTLISEWTIILDGWHSPTGSGGNHSISLNYGTYSGADKTVELIELMQIPIAYKDISTTGGCGITRTNAECQTLTGDSNSVWNNALCLCTCKSGTEYSTIDSKCVSPNPDPACHLTNGPWRGWFGRVDGKCGCIPAAVEISGGTTITSLDIGYNQVVVPSDKTWCIKDTTCSYGKFKYFDKLSYTMKCKTLPIPGCMDSAANNYDSTATTDNGSCTYDAAPVPGCMDSAANNYDSTATTDNGSCTYDNIEPEDKGLPSWVIPVGLGGALVMGLIISKK